MAKHYPILLKRVLLPFLGALVALVSVTCSQGKPAARRTQKPLQSAQDAVAKPPSEELRTEQVENTKIGLSPFFDYIPQRERVLVLYTASVQGYVEPCGCTGEPLGGIARWAAAAGAGKGPTAAAPPQAAAPAKKEEEKKKEDEEVKAVFVFAVVRHRNFLYFAFQFEVPCRIQT